MGFLREKNKELKKHFDIISNLHFIILIQKLIFLQILCGVDKLRIEHQPNGIGINLPKGN